jgi:hypothetical protein
MMHTAELLEFFKLHRGDSIVIPGRGGRHWVPMTDGPFDLPVGDPAMGGHAGFGLNVDYVAIARGAGYERTHSVAEIDEFKHELPGILQQVGPVFVRLQVHAEIQNEAIGNRRPWMKRSRQQTVVDLRQGLGLD